MRLIVFVEEESAEAALRVLLPRLVPARCQHRIINLQNKSRLLQNIESRLLGYADRCEEEDLRFVVLVDRDNDDCVRLKRQLDEFAQRAGLATRAHQDGGVVPPFRVLNRVVIEELESWFLGDSDALRSAYPRLPNLDPRKRPFNNPDNGGRWEELEKLLAKHGYPKPYKKIDGARRIAAHMDPARNRSASFCAFRDGLADLLRL
jgi:hypothetical protein